MIVLCNYLCHLHSKFMPWGYNVCQSVLPLLTFSYTLFLCMYQLYKVLFLMRLELFLPTSTIYYETLYKMYWDSWHGFWGVFFSVRLFVGSAWPFGFFIPATAANDLRLRRISIPDFIHYIFCPIFILQKEPVFPFLMLSAKRELLVPFL